MLVTTAATKASPRPIHSSGILRTVASGLARPQNWAVFLTASRNAAGRPELAGELEYRRPPLGYGGFSLAGPRPAPPHCPPRSTPAPRPPPSAPLRTTSLFPSSTPRPARLVPTHP